MTTVWKEWNGPKVKGEMARKAARQLNDLAQDGVAHVQLNSPRNTGFMANTMEQTHEATEKDLSAAWGNITADYTLWVEIGARGRAGVYMLRRSLDHVSSLWRQKR